MTSGFPFCLLFRESASLFTGLLFENAADHFQDRRPITCLSIYVSTLNILVFGFEVSGGVMKFVMEFAEKLVLRLMEDPEERDRKFREHLYAVKERCKKTKEMRSLPLRPYGFWTFERHNAQLIMDAKISQVPGRRDPYDDLLPQGYDTARN